MNGALTDEQKAIRVAARLQGLSWHNAMILAVITTDEGVELQLDFTEGFSSIHGPGDLVAFTNRKFGYVSERNKDWFHVSRMSNVQWLHDSATVGDFVVFFHSATNTSVESAMLNQIVKKK